MYLKRLFIGWMIIAICIGLASSVAYTQKEFQGEYTRQETLKDNWLELFWAYDNAEGWIDNVLVTRGGKVLLAENFDSNKLNTTVWVAQLPDNMFSVEDGALYVNKIAKNVTGIYAAAPFQPPFVFEFDLKYGSGYPRGSLVSEESREGKGGTVVWWATEISTGQDAGGTVGVFSNGWVVLGNLPLDEYNHYKISVSDEKKAQVAIIEGPGKPVKMAVEPTGKLATAWGKIKLMY